MPEIFLSPSLQPWNPYINGGNEAEYMGYIADALEPYLTQNGISYTRSRMPNTLANAISASNAGNYALHLALHSNAAPEGREGQFRGIQAYYYPTSTKGRAAALDLVDSLRNIYPDPDLVYTVPTTTITEVRRTKAPAVLLEIGYHDNPDDAAWIKANIQNIASAIAKGLTEFFGLPFTEVCTSAGQTVTNAQLPSVNTYVLICTSDNNNLNIRAEPTLQSAVIGQIPSGQKALLLKKLNNGWAQVRYNSVEGYSSGNYLCTCGGTNWQTGRVNTEGGNLNLRAAPSLTGQIIGRIPDNSTVTVLDSTDNWYRVRYMGATGYVLKDFIVI